PWSYLFVHCFNQNERCLSSLIIQYHYFHISSQFVLFLTTATKAKLAAEWRRERELQIKELQKKQESMTLVNVVAKIGTPDQMSLAKENEILTKERLCSGLVLFEHVLNRLRDFLNEEDSGGSTWYSLPSGSIGNSVSTAARDSSNSGVANDILSLESCSHFHRIWSAIQLVFCTPFGQNEYTVEEMFGEGLSWAGCAIILLLGQQRRFEILDFGGHLLRLQRADKKDMTPEGVVSFHFLPFFHEIQMEMNYTTTKNSILHQSSRSIIRTALSIASSEVVNYKWATVLSSLSFIKPLSSVLNQLSFPPLPIHNAPTRNTLDTRNDSLSKSVGNNPLSGHSHFLKPH
ncbi:Cytoplasmic FMR1-interacting protein, partial [Fasciola gigantica]